MPLRYAAPSPPQILNSLYRLAKAHLCRPPDFLSGHASQDEKGNIEANLRKRRILFAGFVARMGDTRLPKCVMFGEMAGGAGCVGGQEKE